MPLTLTLVLFGVLLLAQSAALAAAARGLWRAVPAWSIYLCLVTAHLVVGFAGTATKREYPLVLLYFEPLIILGQIVFTFETGIKMSGFKFGTGSPESRLLIWLIPLVPAAIVMPIEIGFIHDALVGWNNHESDSLGLVYNVRRFLSLTLLFVLLAIPVAVRLGKKAARPAALLHHNVVTAYIACGAAGYLGKLYSTGNLDFLLTSFFFVVGPMACFLTWSWKMWMYHPADFEAFEVQSANDTSTSFDRGALLNL